MLKVYHSAGLAKVRRFLYSHLPGPLHYTFAFFRCSRVENHAEVGPERRLDSECGDLAVPDIEFQIKSRLSEEKHGSR